jgi:hypothetical protein
MYAYPYSLSEIIINCICIAIDACTVILSIKAYLRHHHRYFFFLIITMVSMTLFQFIQFVVNAGYAPLGNVIGRLFFLGMMLSLLLFFDLLSRDSYDAKKVVVYCVSGTVMVITQIYRLLIRFWLERDTFNDDEVYLISGVVRDLVMIGLFAYILVLLLYWLHALYRRAPAELKRSASFAMVGGMLVLASMLVLLAAYPSGASSGDYFGFFIALLILNAGFLSFIWQFYKHPELGFLLPYRVMRMMVFNPANGIPIYTYTWDEKLANEDIFSGMLQAIASVMHESINMAQLREIILDNSVLIIERHPNLPLAFVLICSKSTRMLRSALNLFESKFIAEFHGILSESVTNLAPFQAADRFIFECYPFSKKPVRDSPR